MDIYPQSFLHAYKTPLHNTTVGTPLLVNYPDDSPTYLSNALKSLRVLVHKFLIQLLYFVFLRLSSNVLYFSTFRMKQNTHWLRNILLHLHIYHCSQYCATNTTQKWLVKPHIYYITQHCFLNVKPHRPHIFMSTHKSQCCCCWKRHCSVESSYFRLWKFSTTVWLARWRPLGHTCQVAVPRPVPKHHVLQHTQYVFVLFIALISKIIAFPPLGRSFML